MNFEMKEKRVKLPSPNPMEITEQVIGTLEDSVSSVI